MHGWLRLAASLLLVAGCSSEDPRGAAGSRTEADQQVKRLREDTEIELQDLRGRWLAAEGALTRLRDVIEDRRKSSDLSHKSMEERLLALEGLVAALADELAQLRKDVKTPAPATTLLQRLARSYEEIYCLRKQGAEEAVGAVYRRYGFADVSEWAEAWRSAARDEAFEREVGSRVERLCP